MITKQGAIKRTTDGMRLVGRGTYGILLDEDRAPIAYGMAPKPLIDKIETMFREKLSSLNSLRNSLTLSTRSTSRIWLNGTIATNKFLNSARGILTACFACSVRERMTET